jgi:hypothetical protein
MNPEKVAMIVKLQKSTTSSVLLLLLLRSRLSLLVLSGIDVDEVTEL